MKILKCPFCGGTSRLRGTSPYYYQCQICGAGTRETQTAEEATKLWQARRQLSPCDVCVHKPPNKEECRKCPAR